MKKRVVKFYRFLQKVFFPTYINRPRKKIIFNI